MSSATVILKNSPHLIKLFESLNKLRHEKNVGSVNATYLNNKRVIIFGAGSAGKKTQQELEDSNQILAFLDNDLAKQGKSISGIPILAPSEINNILFDHVVIKSSCYLEIYRQLVQELSIQTFKIK